MKFLGHIAISLLVQWSLLLETSAYPFQAGHCNAGPIPSSPSNQHYDYGGSEPGLGAIENAGFKVTFNGVELDTTKTNYINPGETYDVAIEQISPNSSANFKGLLVRADNTEGDGSEIPVGAIAVASGDVSIKKHPTCESNSIPSVTHTSRDVKTSAQFTFMTTVIAPEFRLDVTLVESGQTGIWYYDLFTLSTAPPETISPVPTPIPNDESPSASPSEESAPSASPSEESERCGPKALDYDERFGVKVKKVGSVPVISAAPWSYNMQPMDNFSGDSIYFLDQLFGKVYSYNQATKTTSTEPIFDMNTSKLPDGVTLDWDLGSAGQTYKVKSMTKTPTTNKVVLVMTSSTLPVGWNKADAELPAKGAYSQWVCGPDQPFWMRDIFRPGVLPACSDVGSGQTTFTGYDVFVTYTINDDGNLKNPRPFFVAENYVGPGHLGGGIATLNDGDILYSVGDCSHFGLDGTYPPQMNSEHCGKIMRIKNSETKRKYTVVAKGVRNPQQMRIFRRGGQTLLGFMDIGGATAEEVNAYPLKKIKRAKQIQNFGWGRNQKDGKAREGTFYVGPGNGLKLGADEPPCEESAPIGEAGFIQPWIQFGRTPTDFFYAISSFAVPTKGLDKFKLIWSEFNTGMLLGTKQDPKFDGNYKGPARSFKIRLYDTSGNELKNGFNDLVKEELGEVGYFRGDPRLFHYPDGSAGVFIERTGAFYKLTEIVLTQDVFK